MSQVDVFERASVGDQFQQRESTLDEELRRETDGPFRLIFGKGFSPTKCGHDVSPSDFDDARYGIPSEFWAAACTDTNGVFGCRYSYGKGGIMNGHDTWCCFRIQQLSPTSGLNRIQSIWNQVAIFIKWRAISGVGFILCLDSPWDMETRIRGNLPSMISRMDPYVWHALFLEEIKKQHNMGVWSMLKLLWKIEQTFKFERYLRTDFYTLYLLARRIIVSKELLEVANLVVDSLANESKVFHEQQKNISTETYFPIQRRLITIGGEIKILEKRLGSIHERLKNEITLAFNIVSQKQSEMGIQLAEHAKTDNTAMRTIALVSLIYLPGTFVSGIFGTNFFQFNSGLEDNHIKVSKNFWIYWAIAAPLTLMTLIIWLSGHYWNAIAPRLRICRRFNLKA